jgi:uncharacterized damage-inducible protein DinB
MFTAIEHFVKDYAQVSNNTLKIMKTMTDDSLGQKVYDGGRRLDELAWHIVHITSRWIKEANVRIPLPELDGTVPKEANIISETYKQYSQTLLQELPKQWTDNMLLEEIQMYGKWMWKRGFMLSTFIIHEVHHRGQMTVLMRQAGLSVPGVCGPAKEEWAAMGMIPQK